jgi:hypothetical protein
MQKSILESDIHVLCVKAESFPEGVKAAFQKLQSLLASPLERKYYGISFLSKDNEIIYKAAAGEKFPGEGNQYDCDSMVIKKGTYNTITISGYMKNIPAIGAAFKQLLAQPGIDPEAPCVEIYDSMEEMRCMVKLK